MKLRQQRLADEIRDIIGSCFLGGQMSDPRLTQVTITAVKLSGDLQLASVYFRVYDQAVKDQAKIALQRAAGLLRKRLAEVLDVRRVPNLRFFYDESLERAAKIETLLTQISL
jgi:ribosome-binding factor A